MPCRVCRPSVAKVSTPSAVLPSSSTLTLDRPIVPPITLACALMAKWPKPPPGSGFCPTQVSALRSDAASAASVPSILRVGLTLIAPSKAALIGVPATRSFTPVRLPASAAGKSPSVSVTSSGSSCQTKWPVAPKLLEIDGHASEKATSLSVSSTLFCLLRTNTVPFSMRISENAARRGESLPGCAPAPRSGRPVGRAVRLQVDRDGRPLQRHVGNFDPADQQRKKAQAARSAARRSARPLGVAQHHIGETDTAGGKQRDAGFAAQDRVQAGDGANFAQDLSAHRIG